MFEKIIKFKFKEEVPGTFRRPGSAEHSIYAGFPCAPALVTGLALIQHSAYIIHNVHSPPTPSSTAVKFMSTSIVTQFPPELLFNICAAVYDAGVPAANPSLDPVLIDQPEAPTALPSSYPSSHWPESVARRTLSNLCLVNHAWSEAAKPWLWHRVEVRLPQSWMAFVEEIAGDEEVTEENVDQSIRHAATAALALKSPEILSDEEAKRLHDSIVASLSSPDSSIPPELLSPPASREPSPRRLRAKSKSPARWKIMRSINDALQNVMEQDGAGFYGDSFRQFYHRHTLLSRYTVPTPVDPHPGKYVRHIDFNHFRTIGMRRSVGEGIERRFVTGERLENILKVSPVYPFLILY